MIHINYWTNEKINKFFKFIERKHLRYLKRTNYNQYAIRKQSLQTELDMLKDEEKNNSITIMDMIILLNT